jgi:hypothetical protein
MEVHMRKLYVLCLVLAVASPGAAFSRGGGMGSHHSASRGGATPGTNSLGTGNPAVDREDKRVAKIVGSICRGC